VPPRLSDSVWDRFASTPPFSGIQDPEFLVRLKANAAIRRVPKSMLVIKEGERPAYLYFVAEGKVQLLASRGNRVTTLELYEAPAAFPLDTIICDALALESARTLSTTVAVALPAEAIRIAFREDACFARAVAQTLAVQKRRSTSFRKMDTLLTGAERVAHWALQVADEQTGMIKLPVSKKILAAQLSMAPANLSRMLAVLNQHGLLNHGHQLYVRDRKKLEEFARANSNFQL
jgi:CRP/FNR family transcriptional regulator, transcriptional activator FtrB